jgi:hypothetical protein
VELAIAPAERAGDAVLQSVVDVALELQLHATNFKTLAGTVHGAVAVVAVVEDVAELKLAVDLEREGLVIAVDEEALVVPGGCALHE